ncbi:hypothetical protein ZWY2020_005883 [Hordeum vulgare]|nr:hypothetical protein ZWY2020_005883 [Hordeum vulgare]
MPALGLRSPSMVPLMGLVPVRALSSAAGSRLISHRSAATVDRLRPDIYSEDEMARLKLLIMKPQGGSVAPICNPKGLSSQQDDGSQGVKVIPSLDDLLEDICRRIHARMPLRDAARLGCASHTFWRSWRCYPNLDLRQKTLGLDGDHISKVDHILKNHSGIGMKKLRIELFDCDKMSTRGWASWPDDDRVDGELKCEKWTGDDRAKSEE